MISYDINFILNDPLTLRVIVHGEENNLNPEVVALKALSLLEDDDDQEEF